MVQALNTRVGRWTLLRSDQALRKSEVNRQGWVFITAVDNYGRLVPVGLGGGAVSAIPVAVSGWDGALVIGIFHLICEERSLYEYRAIYNAIRFISLDQLQKDQASYWCTNMNCWIKCVLVLLRRPPSVPRQGDCDLSKLKMQIL